MYFIWHYFKCGVFFFLFHNHCPLFHFASILDRFVPFDQNSLLAIFFSSLFKKKIFKLLFFFYRQVMSYNSFFFLSFCAAATHVCNRAFMTSTARLDSWKAPDCQGSYSHSANLRQLQNRPQIVYMYTYTKPCLPRVCSCCKLFFFSIV
jgi:hypothetical protein